MITQHAISLDGALELSQFVETILYATLHHEINNLVF